MASLRRSAEAAEYGGAMSDSPPPRGRTGVTIGVVTVLIIAVLVVIAVGRHRTSSRGAASPTTAATLFVGAINAGSGDGAAAISCTSFADGARSTARSGADPGISYKLGDVLVDGNTATAQLQQTFDIAGSPHQSQHQLTLKRSGGRWLVCGQI